MRIRIGKDINISHYKSGRYCCSFCEKPMGALGISVGSAANNNRENAWLCVECTRNIADLLRYRMQIELPLAHTIGVDYNHHYCSYCGEWECGLFMKLKKLNNLTLPELRAKRTPIYIHLRCLKKLQNKIRRQDIKEFASKIMIEEL